MILIDNDAISVHKRDDMRILETFKLENDQLRSSKHNCGKDSYRTHLPHSSLPYWKKKKASTLFLL